MGKETVIDYKSKVEEWEEERIEYVCDTCGHLIDESEYDHEPPRMSITIHAHANSNRSLKANTFHHPSCIDRLSIEGGHRVLADGSILSVPAGTRVRSLERFVLQRHATKIASTITVCSAVSMLYLQFGSNWAVPPATFIVFTVVTLAILILLGYIAFNESTSVLGQ